MKKFIKLFMLMLIVPLAFVLVGCDNDKKGGDTTGGDETTTTTTEDPPGVITTLAEFRAAFVTSTNWIFTQNNTDLVEPDPDTEFTRVVQRNGGLLFISTTRQDVDTMFYVTSEREYFQSAADGGAWVYRNTPVHNIAEENATALQLIDMFLATGAAESTYSIAGATLTFSIDATEAPWSWGVITGSIQLGGSTVYVPQGIIDTAWSV
jgi:uncharacterized lipoprotein NlpE involved in copper resistance